jgi:hypothetical protein
LSTRKPQFFAGSDRTTFSLPARRSDHDYFPKKKIFEFQWSVCRSSGEGELALDCVIETVEILHGLCYGIDPAGDISIWGPGYMGVGDRLHAAAFCLYILKLYKVCRSFLKSAELKGKIILKKDTGDNPLTLEKHF